ncbi:MAG: hypothetical protein K2X34_04040 [Hyphomonadaceae bacterium]|nr:hypothetical protein [Hyphomonadaceae bacterium]
MKHALLLAALTALAACASPAPPTPRSGGLSIGHDLSCDASEVVRDNAPPMTIYITLEVPNNGGDGNFCIATGCETAVFEPTSSSSGGYAAIMRTNDRTNWSANLEIAQNLRSFTLRQTDSEGTSTWTGTCNAAGS